MPQEPAAPSSTSTPHGPDFNRRAADYARHAHVQKDAAAWLAEWLPPQLDGPALELGAGTGIFTRHLTAYPLQLSATDSAPQMVRIGAAAFPGVHWHVADAASPHGGPYRWIFHCSLAQWLPDPAHALTQWRRAATPGARLIAGWFIEGTLSDFFQTCPEAAPFAWKTTETWLQLLDQSGWRVLRYEEKRFVRHHRNTAAMLRAVHEIGAAVPHRLRVTRLRQALRHHDHAHAGKNGVSSTFAFLRVEAENP